MDSAAGEGLGITPTARIRSDKQDPAQAKLERGTLKSRLEARGGPPATLLSVPGAVQTKGE
jgi:hypothetical protein